MFSCIRLSTKTGETTQDALGVQLTYTDDNYKRHHYLLAFQSCSDKSDRATVTAMKSILTNYGLLELVESNQIATTSDAALRGAAKKLYPDSQPNNEPTSICIPHNLNCLLKRTLEENLSQFLPDAEQLYLVSHHFTKFREFRIEFENW